MILAKAFKPMDHKEGCRGQSTRPIAVRDGSRPSAHGILKRQNTLRSPGVAAQEGQQGLPCLRNGDCIAVAAGWFPAPVQQAGPGVEAGSWIVFVCGVPRRSPASRRGIGSQGAASGETLAGEPWTPGHRGVGSRHDRQQPDRALDRNESPDFRSSGCRAGIRASATQLSA